MQQEARDAAVAVRAAAFENPPVFARDLVEIDLAAFASGFDAAWHARGEADRAAVAGEAEKDLSYVLWRYANMAIAALDEQ